MIIQPLFLRRQSFAAAAASIALAHAASATTTLTFDGFGSNNTIPVTFADNATGSATGYSTTAGVDGFTGTPNIDIGWVGTPATQSTMDFYNNWQTAGNSVWQTDFQATTAVAATLTLPFTPAAGYGVLISSFTVDQWTGGGAGTYGWSITSGATTLASGSFALSGGANVPVSTGITQATAQTFGGATMNLVLSKGIGLSGSYLAIDNLVFDQVTAVPEPAGAALAGLALGAAALRRRRA